MTVGADAHSGSILAVGNALLRDLTDMFQKLDPPQKYSHSGIMIRNQDQLRH